VLTVDVTKSRVRVETEAAGLLAALAHDLRIDAPIEAGSSSDGQSCVVHFRTDAMRVFESRRHGNGAWHPPSPSDAKDIEQRIHRELFQDSATVAVEGRLDGSFASLTVRARKAQTVRVPIRVERGDSGVRAQGRCELSLLALGTGRVHVPLGAIKLVDAVKITFDVVFAELSS
jgi:hypothetical protein